MTVSVVVPTFNSERTIARALRSVLAQALRPAEVVVVDDCSTDGTVVAVEGLRASFAQAGVALEIQELPQNIGGAAARNLGLEIAKNRIIALLDSDDCWAPAHLRESLSSRRNDNCMTVSRTTQFFSDKKFKIIPNIRLQDGESPLDYIFCRNGIIQTSSIVLFGSACDIRFDERLRKHQDFDLVATAFQMGMLIIQVWRPNTEYHDYGSGDRVSVQRKPAATRTFYLKWRSALSPSARRAFLARFLMPQLAANERWRRRTIFRAAAFDMQIARPLRLRLILKSVFRINR